MNSCWALVAVCLLVVAFIPDSHLWQHYADVTTAFLAGCLFVSIFIKEQDK